MFGIAGAIATLLLALPSAGAEGAPMSRPEPTTAQAVLGGGCFWCLEAVYEDVPGVLDVTSGYAGGATEDPSYQQVITGRTGHAEVVRITYDPDRIDYDKLLEIFWVIHDPTTADRQGNDVGSQYRSIILFTDEAQQRAARASIAREEAAGTHAGPFTTTLEALERFWPAEDYHQDYFRNNPDKPYCAFVVAPKVQKFLQHVEELEG
jgi:peptide-methionine (S)-S-oxide reductase